MTTKFNVVLSTGLYSTLGEAAEWLHEPMAEVLREAVYAYWLLAGATRSGHALSVERSDSSIIEVHLPAIELALQGERLR